MRKFQFIVLLTAVITLISSCGQDTKNTKKDGGSGDRGSNNTRPVYELNDFVKNQKLSCGEESCPDYLTKIVVIYDNKASYCTGVLVNKNTVMTASSCIPRPLRIRGLQCSSSIYAVFEGEKSNIIPCNQILETDNKISFLEPSMWQGDYFFFNLSSEVEGDVAPLNFEGMKDQENLSLWKIDFKDSQKSEIKKSNCNGNHGSYLNPFVDNIFHPMQVVQDCEVTLGAQGSPLLNQQNEVVGFLSQEMSGSLYAFLSNSDVLVGELSHYHHATNLACIEFLGTGSDPKACRPNLSLTKLDNYRADILKGTNLNHSNRTQIEASLEKNFYYFKWDFEFTRDEVTKNFDLKIKQPRCIVDTNKWIREFYTRSGRAIYNRGTRKIEVPNFTFETKLNSSLKPVSVTREIGTKVFTFEFNPWQSHVEKTTFINLNYTLFGNPTTERFENIKPCN